MKYILAIGAIVAAVSTASAGPADCDRNQVYSSSMAQCIPKSLMCSDSEVYSSSMAQCIPKRLMCDSQHVFRRGRCVWRRGE